MRVRIDLISLAVFAIVAAAALIFFVLIRKETRCLIWRDKGRCPGCGYDLRASPERCPECGLSVINHPIGRLDFLALRDDWPTTLAEPPSPKPDEDMVVLYEGAIEAEVLKEQLLARGIWAEVRTKQPWELHDVVGRQVTVKQVLTARSDVESARLVLHRFRRRPDRTVDNTHHNV